MAVGRTDKEGKIEVMEKRLDILVGTRLRDRTGIENAILTQDRLRGKSKGWQGAKEIRKWRESR